MNLTDTHCHLDTERFNSDRASMLARAASAGVSRMLVPSLRLSSADRVLSLAAHHADVFAAVGIHPTHMEDSSAAWRDELRVLAGSPKVAAIGEIGLDYYWVTDAGLRRRQLEGLRVQLEVAADSSLPVVLHLREEGDSPDGRCASDMLEMLDSWTSDLRDAHSPLVGRAGVLHSFSGTINTARRAIDLGFYIGITGPVTFPAAAARRELARQLPLERLLIETDAPFLAPQRYRGRRNEPAFVGDIADKIAEVRSRQPSEVADMTATNAARLFAWGDPV